MKIQTCRFVASSEVFDFGGPAWNLFEGSNPDCTWGSNNRSMIDRDSLIDIMQNAHAVYKFNLDEPFQEETEEDVQRVIKNLQSLDADIYIDLET